MRTFKSSHTIEPIHLLHKLPKTSLYSNKGCRAHQPHNAASRLYSNGFPFAGSHKPPVHSATQPLSQCPHQSCDPPSLTTLFRPALESSQPIRCDQDCCGTNAAVQTNYKATPIEWPHIAGPCVQTISRTLFLTTTMISN
jgi:hypothetical protein